MKHAQTPGSAKLRRALQLAAASVLFLLPILLWPHAQDASADAWTPLGLRGETVRMLSVASSGGERIVYAETATGLWRYAVGRRQPIAASRSPAGQSGWLRSDASLPRTPLGGPALASWRVVPGRATQLYAVTGAGTARQLYRTEDGGETWQLIGPAPGQTARPPLVVVPGLGGGPDTILLVTDSRVQRSTDGGASWSPGGPWPDDAAQSALAEPVKGAVVRLLLSDPSAADRLYALTERGAFWVSETGGLAWRVVPAWEEAGDAAFSAAARSAGRPFTALAITPYFGVRIWAATTAGVAYSADNGATWTAQPSTWSHEGGRVGGHATSLLVDTRVADTLYVALGSGDVYRTDGPRLGWSYLGRPGSRNITALALDPETRGLLYAATDDGVWVRTVTPLQPTPAPTPSETHTPQPAATARPTATSSPSRLPTAVASPTPTIETDMASPAARATTTPAATPTRTPTRSATPAPTETRTTTPTSTITPSPLPTETLPPTQPPAPTQPAAAPPTATPRPATATAPPPTAVPPTETPFATPAPR